MICGTIDWSVFVTCCVYDLKGNALCDEQYTGISRKKEGKLFHFYLFEVISMTYK